MLSVCCYDRALLTSILMYGATDHATPPRGKEGGRRGDECGEPPEHRSSRGYYGVSLACPSFLFGLFFSLFHWRLFSHWAPSLRPFWSAGPIRVGARTPLLVCLPSTPLSQLRFFFPPYCVWARHIYHATCRSEPSLSRCHPTYSSSPSPPAPCATTLPHNGCASHVILKIKELPPANHSKTKCHAVPCPKSKTRRSQESPVTIPPNSNSAKVIPRPPASSC